MAKKSPEKTSESYKFSQLYYEKKARIQEAGNSAFIEFLNWVENINKGEKKEDGKRLIDDWFNKYSDSAIVLLFNLFVEYKENKPKGYKYENILNGAREAYRTKIFGTNIIGQLFGYYGNYLKYLKRKGIDFALKETVESKPGKADKLKKRDKQRVAEVLKEKETKKDGINEDNEKKAPTIREPIQLTIPFPEDDLEEVTKTEKKEGDPNQDELYNDQESDYEYSWQRRNNK